MKKYQLNVNKPRERNFSICEGWGEENAGNGRVQKKSISDVKPSSLFNLSQLDWKRNNSNRTLANPLKKVRSSKASENKVKWLSERKEIDQKKKKKDRSRLQIDSFVNSFPLDKSADTIPPFSQKKSLIDRIHQPGEENCFSFVSLASSASHWHVEI